MLMQTYQGLFGGTSITIDPIRDQITIIIDHKGGNKQKFEKINIGDWQVDANGNSYRQILCMGNGDNPCDASLSLRPNSSDLDVIIENQINAIKNDVVNIFNSGQINGSTHFLMVSNDGTNRVVNIYASWEPLDNEKICIVFNFTIN